MATPFIDNLIRDRRAYMAERAKKEAAQEAARPPEPTPEESSKEGLKGLLRRWQRPLPCILPDKLNQPVDTNILLRLPPSAIRALPEYAALVAEVRKACPDVEVILKGEETSAVTIVHTQHPGVTRADYRAVPSSLSDVKAAMVKHVRHQRQDIATALWEYRKRIPQANQELLAYALGLEQKVRERYVQGGQVRYQLGLMNCPPDYFFSLARFKRLPGYQKLLAVAQVLDPAATVEVTNVSHRWHSEITVLVVFASLPLDVAP